MHKKLNDDLCILPIVILCQSAIMVSSNKGNDLPSRSGKVKVDFMKIRLIEGADVKVVPTFETYRVYMKHGYHYAPITKVEIDRYTPLYTARIPNSKGDRLVYLDDYRKYVFYVPHNEDIWSEFTIAYELTDTENDILGLDEGYADIVADNISNRFNTYGYLVDSDLIKEFCYTIIAPEYTMDEIKDMLLEKELSK